MCPGKQKDPVLWDFCSQHHVKGGRSTVICSYLHAPPLPALPYPVDLFLWPNWLASQGRAWEHSQFEGAGKCGTTWHLVVSVHFAQITCAGHLETCSTVAT